MANSSAVMEIWGSAVKTSASYNWRNSRPNFNYNSGPTFIRTVNSHMVHKEDQAYKAPLGLRGKLISLFHGRHRNIMKNMVDRGIFDSECSGQHDRFQCMRTRSSSNLVGESSPNPTTSNPKRRNRRRSKQPFSLEESPLDTMADQRTMAELLCAPTEGYAEAIVVPPILAEHFETS
ncbi:hypothetical protein Tco_0037797 [Tanacetum coccineum]